MEPQRVSDDDKLFGALSYIWIVSVIMLLLKKDNAFVSFHAKQGIVLFLGSLIWFIPGLGWLIAVVSLVLMVIGFEKAYHGEKYKMPVISKLAELIK